MLKPGTSTLQNAVVIFHRTIFPAVPENLLKPLTVLCRLASTSSSSVALRNGVSVTEEWQRRNALHKPIIQRFEKTKPKLFYAPEWPLDENPNGDEGYPNPLKMYGMTPEKWNYYNKVVWPPNFVNPETGLPVRRQVFHCKESVHCSPKRMWTACYFIRKRNVDDAILQLNFTLTRACAILKELLEEAKERARNEFNVEFPSEMHIAEAFPVQCKIVKSARRHAHEQWHEIRHRYIHIFVRLEEGEGPGLPAESRKTDGWQKMEEYYKYLRSRDIKYSI